MKGKSELGCLLSSNDTKRLVLECAEPRCILDQDGLVVCCNSSFAAKLGFAAAAALEGRDVLSAGNSPDGLSHLALRQADGATSSRRCLLQTVVDDGERRARILQILRDQSVDWSIVDQLKGIGEAEGQALYRELVAMVKRNAPKQFENLAAAITDGECERAAREAHAIKSATSFLGAVNLASICELIREMASRADTIALSRLTAIASGEFLSILNEVDSRA
ncbi:MAG: Hpt domain-containing protein [Calothrix sp. SM1_5_4]|nr:Hpt domain-containing protein [Calothrix sp. SM1_5_4]